jgi:hypothetical protein
LSEAQLSCLPELRATFAALERWDDLVLDPNEVRATFLAALNLLDSLASTDEGA